MGKRSRRNGMVATEMAILIALIVVTGIMAWTQFGAHVATWAGTEGVAFGATADGDTPPAGGSLHAGPSGALMPVACSR